jgi:hypothetical protein
MLPRLFMKAAIAVIIMMAASLTGPAGKSVAQTVQDDESVGGGKFLRAVSRYCPGAKVMWSTSEASIYLSDKYLEDRSLDAIARSIAFEGLNDFPHSGHFSVRIQGSRGQGSADVNR